jgi:hypothetical protein
MPDQLVPDDKDDRPGPSEWEAFAAGRVALGVEDEGQGL